MNRLIRQLRNTGALTFAKMLRPVFSFLLIKMIASSGGSSGHGQYTTVFNYIVIFEIIAAFGINRLMAREIAQNKDNAKKYFVNAAIFLIPIAIGATLVMSGLVYFLKWSPDLMYAAWILAASLIASSLNQCSEGILVGFERMHIIGIIWTVENFLRVAISILLIYLGFGLKSLVITYVVLKYGMLIYYLVYLNKFLGKPVLRVDKKLSRDLFSTARTFALTVVFVTVYWKLDMLMLKEMKGDDAVGVYDGAYRFFGIIIILISNFVLSIFPAFSEFFKQSADKFRMIAGKTLKYFIIVAIPFVILFILFSDFLILRIFNSGYTESVSVLRILAFAVIPYGMTEIFAHMLLASSRQKVDMAINGTGMLINIILNFILIPPYSYLGAAIATLISIHIYLGIQILYIRRKIFIIRSFQLLNFAFKIFIATLIMVSLIIAFYFLHVQFLSLLTPALFFLLIWKLKAISVEDKEVIHKLLQKFKVVA